MSVVSWLSTTHWFPIGPAPIDAPGVGLDFADGRIEAAAPHPTDENTMYVGGNNGGVWKTAIWTRDPDPPIWIPFSDDQRSLNFAGYHPLVVHPANHQHVLGAVCGLGAGVIKSTNGGVSWTLLGNSTFEGAAIGSIAVHPTDKQILYVSVWWGGPGGGVYQSTDGGLNWKNKTPFHSGGVTDVIIAKFNPKILYAGLVGSVSTNGVYKSKDGGATWDIMTGLPSSFFLADAVRLESASATGVVYVTLFSNDLSATTSVQRYRTTDAGATWKHLAATPGTPELRSWHVLLGVDPKDHNHVFANDAYSLFESTDGGQLWKRADMKGPKAIGDDWVNIGFDAKNRVVVTADRDAYIYNPAKKSWLERSGNLQVTQFYTISLDPQTPDLVYGVAQDHPFAMKFDATIEWNYMAGGGETGKVLVDPGNSNRLYVSDPLNPGNLVKRSTNGGGAWTTIFSTAAYSAGDYSLAYSSQKSFAIDPSNSKRLLIGLTKVFETKNATSATPTWAKISGILSPSSSVANQYITALAIAPSNGKVIYAATSDGHVWVTTNGGTHWKQRDDGLFGTGAGAVVDIRIDPADSNHAFAVSTSLGGVWHLRTVLGVLKWKNISGDLPSNLNEVTILADWRFTVAALYVGTSRGVYHSVNKGANWSRFGLDMPNTVVYDLQSLIKKDVLAAGTFGRGVWEILIPKSKISGKVFSDTDGDGETGPGLAGVTVFLDVDGNGVLDDNDFQTTTDSKGNYVFEAVPPGPYVVCQVPPTGHVQTTRKPGGITVSGSNVSGVDFGNRLSKEPRKMAEPFVHATDLSVMHGRLPGKAIGAKDEFGRRAQKSPKKGGKKSKR